MQRPMMDTMYVEERHETPIDSGPKLHERLAPIVRLLLRLGRATIHFAFPRRRADFIDERPLVGRIFQAVARKAIFAAPLVAVATAGFVYRGVHPAPLDEAHTPMAPSMFHERVEFMSKDGVALAGWLVPVVNAEQVVALQEKAYRRKFPGVVLAHDYGRSPEQMLPLIAPLHESGCVVLAVGLRGEGAGMRVASTFGLNESDDVLAAVETLRKRPMVDGERIAVVGVGIGASAALLAAESDGRLMVAAMDPPRGFEEVAARHIGPQKASLRWMRPLCRWGFEAAFHVDGNRIDLDRHRNLTASSKAMTKWAVTDDGHLREDAVQSVCAFVKTTLKPNPPMEATASVK